MKKGSGLFIYIIIAIVLMFWGTISMYGQSKMISGIVQSESDGEPLVGATVIVKETKAGGSGNDC